MTGDGTGAARPDSEPDYRFTLANERTFLAWLRTALALDAAGVAVIHLLPELAVPGARELIGLVLVALGGLVGVSAYLRWRSYQRALRQGLPLPPTRLPLLLVVALFAVSALAALLLLVERTGT